MFYLPCLMCKAIRSCHLMPIFIYIHFIYLYMHIWDRVTWTCECVFLYVTHAQAPQYYLLRSIDKVAFVMVILLFLILLLQLLRSLFILAFRLFCPPSFSFALFYMLEILHFLSGCSLFSCTSHSHYDLSKFIVKYFVAKINFTLDIFNLINIMMDR